MLEVAGQVETQGWLKCRLDKGMFSDERAVTYPETGDWQKSVFVPVNATEGSPGGIGRVQVQIVSRDGRTLCVLPSANRDIVTASEEDVTSQ